MINTIKKKYHWVIALLGCLEMIIFGGILNCQSVFIIPICQEFDVPRASYALANVPYYIISTVFSMLSGFFFQRFGYKKTTVWGLACVVLSMLMMAASRDMTGFTVGKTLLGVGYGVCFTSGAVRLVKCWFVKHQGLLLGLISMCSGLGGSLFSILLSASTEAVGWRMTHVFMGAIIGSIILFYLPFIKDTPDMLGLKPLGFGQVQLDKERHKRVYLRWSGLSFHQWMKKPLFYMMALATIIMGVAQQACSGVLVPHFQDQGLAPEQAAAYQSVYLLALAPAKLLCGAATDRFGAKPVTVCCIAAMVTAQGILGSTADPVLWYLGVGLLSLGGCIATVLLPLLANNMFGYRALDNINGILLGLVCFSGMLSGLVSNSVYDIFGSYNPCFRAAGMVGGMMLMIYPIMFWMSRWERLRDQQTKV